MEPDEYGETSTFNLGLTNPSDPRGGMTHQPDFNMMAFMDGGFCRNGVTGALWGSEANDDGL
jgi:hypothetical protein